MTWQRFAAAMGGLALFLAISSCTTPTESPPSTTILPSGEVGEVPSTAPVPQWRAVGYESLPNWPEASFHEVWGAWLNGCQRPPDVWRALCPDIRQLSLGSDQDKRRWIESHLQPYALSQPDGQTQGLLTSYYEPEFKAWRISPHPGAAPLYRPPATLSSRNPWYTRREIDTLPEARAQLRGRELVYLNDPIEALILHIQGSGKARLQEPDGSVRSVRIAFAATNQQPYKSVARWLIDQGQLRDTSWPAIREWAQRNPARVQEMLWTNPRYVFFKEEPLNDRDQSQGPKGAQGVPLTAGRSIAVDPHSVPYGTPVWINTHSSVLSTSRLVMAQDTGSAITGAVRADYYAGTGARAGELAGRVKQPFEAWVLWPR
jgi:membrane-bound lytic murein transglycosylase A